jgi:hypothetical protein
MTGISVLSNLDELRHQLAIPAINTGRQIHLFGHPAGPVTDDIEGLHAIADENGCIRLISGTEFSMQMYRGQAQEYPRCIPTLSRLEKVEEQILALCRRVAFEDAIGEHPMVSLAERIRLWDLPLYVDREGLAQHYGLATDMLHVTSNFDVASFFATCTWSHEDDQYQPAASDDALGVMYRITPVLMTGRDGTQDALGPVRIVGWQPLPRPEQQRAFVVKMKPGQDFTSLPSVETFHFQHQAHISHRIWNAFDQGVALFPRDAAAELARRAESLSEFTVSQIERAWQRLAQWTAETYSPSQKTCIQESIGITIVESHPLDWNGLAVETSEEQLMEQFREVVDRVRFRMAAYG